MNQTESHHLAKYTKGIGKGTGICEKMSAFLKSMFPSTNTKSFKVTSWETTEEDKCQWIDDYIYGSKSVQIYFNTYILKCWKKVAQWEQNIVK